MYFHSHGVLKEINERITINHRAIYRHPHQGTISAPRFRQMHVSIRFTFLRQWSTYSNIRNLVQHKPSQCDIETSFGDDNKICEMGIAFRIRISKQSR